MIFIQSCYNTGTPLYLCLAETLRVQEIGLWTTEFLVPLLDYFLRFLLFISILSFSFLIHYLLHKTLISEKKEMPGLFDPFELGVIPVYSQETNWTVAFIILVGFFIHGAYLHAKIYDIPNKAVSSSLIRNILLIANFRQPSSRTE